MSITATPTQLKKTPLLPKLLNINEDVQRNSQGTFTAI
jgi:hypothetical protein